MSIHRSTVVLALLAVFGVWIAGCRGDSEQRPGSAAPEPGVTRPPTPDVGSSPPPGPGQPSDGPTGPGPESGRPCPVDQAVCDLAERLVSLMEQGNLDAILALAEPVPATCPSGGLGGPSAALCTGAASGELRFGYWDVQAGEGLIVTEAEWRRTLDRWIAGIAVAQGSDVYGPGGLRIGAISCARDAAQPSGVCRAEEIRSHLTFINSPATDPASGIGLPGQRISFHFTLRLTPTGESRIEGFGTVVPPNSVLLPFEIEAVLREGGPVVVEYYPWTP